MRTDEEILAVYDALLGDESVMQISEMRRPNHAERFDEQACLEFAITNSDSFFDAVSRLPLDTLGND
jgi:hypothetical protein